MFSWLKANSQTLQSIHRSIEREGLRINSQGEIAQTPHPKCFGSALTHKWITTDFSEALLEFITPLDRDIDRVVTLLRDIHRYVIRSLQNERLWPMSIPCSIEQDQSIRLAQYGTSNIGRMKTLYREGLKNRYSALMQIIAGVHYNFSLPLTFWRAFTGINSKTNKKEGKAAISAGYLKMIRNYYRFGWVIPYLFGASPGVSSSFLRNCKINLPFKYTSSGLLYLPYATSLRLSKVGYANHSQHQLGINFNSLDKYIFSLKKAITTPHVDYEHIGLRKNGRYLQLNTNILQNENELYEPIRPKRVTRNNESSCDALMRDGIEYVEVRSLDINPFSPIGVDKEQTRFLDLFLIWCVLAEAPEMSLKEFFCNRNNWNRVILEGRKPGLMLRIDCSSSEQSLSTLGKLLFSDLQKVAKALDSNYGNLLYQEVCDKLAAVLDKPELTISARFLNQLIERGIDHLGMDLANEYYQTLYSEPLEVFNNAQFNEEKVRSCLRQQSLEIGDTTNFDEFLANQKILW